MQISKDLLKLIKKIRNKDKAILDADIIEYIEEIFPNKSTDILDLIRRGIKKYIYKPSNRIVWISPGTDCEHLIYPKIFCSCLDFFNRVVISQQRTFCKHMIAQIIAEELNLYEIIEADDKDFNKQLKYFQLV
ncbi:MAG: hypothetical protein ACP6IY_11695 [Promethearchaeia archaeon]